jgi:hypothetical protein
MLDRYAHLSPAHLWQAIEGLAQRGTGSKTGSELPEQIGMTSERLEKLGAGNGI